MICCLNPRCLNPLNSDDATTCRACGKPLTRLRGRYRTVEPLGQGGFGKTYLALDEDRLNTRCVIKQFSPQLQGTKSLEKAIRLFNQEAIRLDELGEHPQIPTLLAYFEQEGFLYLVQQFIEGQSLLQEMRQQGAFNERQIRDVLSDVLPVLRFIHKHQVIHRDITPNNILRRPDGRLVLIDFGVAKQLNDDPSGDAGTRVGTEGYAPMEQFRGGKAFPASDLYSLGATCLHLMTQSRPDNLYDPLNGRWIWREYLLEQKGVAVSDQLAHILDQMLKDLVGERYHSADEVMRDLNADSFLPAPQSVVVSSPKVMPSSPSNPPSRPPAPPRAATSNPPAPPSRPPTSQPPTSQPPTSKPPTSKPPTSPSPAPRPSLSAPPVATPSARTANRSLRCIHTLMGHSSWVTSVALSPTAPLAASSSLDDTIKLWNLNTGEEWMTLTGHTRGVNTIAISPDGKLLISGSDDYSVKVWSLQSGALLGTLLGHTRDVNAVAVSPDGKLFASGGEDRMIRLWSASTGALVKTLSGVAGMIKALAISRDGRILASGGLDNKTKLWDLHTGEQFQTLIGHVNSVNAVTFNPDGQFVVTASKDKTVRVWNARSGELLRTLAEHIRDVSAVAITPNGKTIISGSSDTTIKLWDLSGGRVSYTWTDHSDTVNAIVTSADGKYMVSGSSDKTVRVWQLPPA
ncbi:protein kinase domain-containing protein [Egbenema bharatensis]|uniref:protein kinase domain-containing protein n=1 Tax=Egbenema bharatensis TaxID=3463334 RepID=UPI003A856634